MLRVKPAPTRFPTSSLYIPIKPLQSMSSVRHPWGDRWRCVGLRGHARSSACAVDFERSYITVKANGTHICLFFPIFGYSLNIKITVQKDCFGFDTLTKAPALKTSILDVSCGGACSTPPLVRANNSFIEDTKVSLNFNMTVCYQFR